MNFIFSFPKFFFSILLCGMLAGCPGPLNVPTAWVDSFTRNGATASEVRVALLECGASVPGDESEYLTPDSKRFPPAFKAYESVWIGKCMKNSGFPFNDVRACAGGTDMNGKLVTPAPCKPDAVIPKRSVENRLNSPYCKTYPETRLCQPVVVSEAEWNETHKEEIEARKLRLNEVRRQGYSTNVGTAEAKYCREEAKKNKTQEKAQSYFETCLKEKFKVWHPFLSY